MSTRLTYTGDGYQTAFAVTFPYISPSHVKVYLNDALQLGTMHYTLSGGSVVFVNPPLPDDVVVIQRQTSPLNPLVDFTDGSTLKADELDTAYLHNFYLSQEYADSFTKLINDALLSIALGNNITVAEPDAVLLELVAQMINSSAAATLQQRISDIDTNAEAIITLGESLQVQINTLAQGVAANVYIQPTEPVPGVGGVPNPILEGSRWYDSDDNNAPYIYQNSAWVSIADPRIGQAVADISVLQTDVGGNAAAIVNEALARSTADSALASTIALLGVQNAGATAFILDSNTVKLDTDLGDTLANRFSQLTAADGANSAAITNEATARVNGDGALASTIALIGVENAGGTAFILDENTVKLSSDTGDTVAQRFTALSAADDANSASIQTIQTVTIPGLGSEIDTLEAKYGVSLNVNGYVTGFVQNNNGTSGSFVILADKFAVVDPAGGSGQTPLVPFEIAGGKINIRADVKIDGSLMVNGTIIGAALVPGTIGTTQIGPNAITTTQLNASAVTADKIAALSITAAKLAAGAVTADKISVTDLSAVNTSTGNLTVSGAITLNTAGHIKGGQTAFNTGTGFFLGYSGAAYKFSIGNSTDFITWDGSELVVRGNLSLGNYTASTDPADTLLDAPTTRYSGDEWNWTEVKKFKINKPGTLRCYFTAVLPSLSGGMVSPGQVRIKRDGTVVASSNVVSTSWATFSHQITTLETSNYITVEIKSGTREPLEPVATGINIKDVSLRGTIGLGEDVITD